MTSPRVNVSIASRNCRAPDWATPRLMMSWTLRGSAASACCARAIGPVSAWDLYSTRAGDVYCTDWAWLGIASTLTARMADRWRVRLVIVRSRYGILAERWR